MPPHPARAARGHARSAAERRLRIPRESIDQPAHRRVGGHRAEHFRLGPQHRDVSQTIPTQRDRDRQVQHRLTRIMNRPGRTPRLSPADRPAANPLTRQFAAATPLPPTRSATLRPPRHEHQNHTGYASPTECLSPCRTLTFDKPIFSSRTGTSVHYSAERTTSHERSRLGIIGTSCRIALTRGSA